MGRGCGPFCLVQTRTCDPPRDHRTQTAGQQEGWRWEARTAMGWEVREGFLEELTWSAVGGNSSGKNNEGQGPVVEVNLSDSRDRREAA